MRPHQLFFFTAPLAALGRNFRFELPFQPTLHATCLSVSRKIAKAENCQEAIIGNRPTASPDLSPRIAPWSCQQKLASPFRRRLL